MVELIGGLVQVRDALSLIAFLGLILLVAFRTKQVPNLFFGLVREKLTRQQFSALLHRFMVLGFFAFLALVSLAVLAQVLNHLTKPGALTIEDLRSELARTKAPEATKIHAEAQYKLSMEKLNQRAFDGAIAALQESIKAVPSLTAQEMMVYLNRQKGDAAGATAAWETAVATARTRGDSLALARLDHFEKSRVVLNLEGDHDLIGKSAPTPKGGDSYESSVAIRPGLYNCTAESPCSWQWFNLHLDTGQAVEVKLRTPPGGGGLAGVVIFGTNGERVTAAGDPAGAMHGNAAPGGTIYQVRWVAPTRGLHYLTIRGDPGTVYRIQVS